MKIVLTTITLMWLVGCTTTPEIKATSSEESLIGTLTENGCLIKTYDRVAKMGKVHVECAQ